MTSTNDIRRGFLDYFGAAQHDIVSSAPLVPYNDPTLMFVNAGMVPFKNVFTGLESRETPRAASSQKCVRAGGKHNDLDNVGYTARHHTFFEMLGNFSFGDYFKEQAITHAWTLLTKEWGLDPARLTTTVYHTDDEAFELWRKIAGLPEDRIIRISTNDNFWSMGDTGPCGPCSEIFYDHGDHIFGGPPGSPDEDGDRFVEIWNLVFMQFERQDDGTDVPLPKPSIDTGMGLERIAAVMQGVTDNYDTDTFKALINASEELTGTKAVGEQKASHRVIADHLRSTSFLLADGVMPSNEGRGYVLRRIMRRAMRHAHILGAKEPLMHRLVGSLAAEMGAAYPELLRAQPMIEATLKQEETQFRRTLDKGIKLLDEATAGMNPGDVLAGDTAFKLYDTYGFPYDLTEDALRAQGFGIDQAGFETAMNNQKAMARAAWKGSGAKASDDVWFDIAERVGSTEFTGYAANEGEGQVVALVKGGTEVQSAGAKDTVTVITNQTPFYGESGGQMGDAGVISSSNMRGEVTDTAKPLGRLHAHQVIIGTGEIKVGDFVTLKIDTQRRDTLRANHSATHLLHASLRDRLGEHVTQKGSMVAPDRLRFDFSHNQAVTPQEIAMIEADVNAQIRGNETVTTRLMTPDDAVAAGALALFGEKYGDTVRAVRFGQSIELCGGTHVKNTGDIWHFKIKSEGAVASGIRRIEAITNDAVKDFYFENNNTLFEIKTLLNNTKNPAKAIEKLQNENISLQKQIERLLEEKAQNLTVALKNQLQEINGVQFLATKLDLDANGIKNVSFSLGKNYTNLFLLFATAPSQEKAMLTCYISKELVNERGFNAGTVVRELGKLIHGGGGGQNFFATAGGKNPAGIPEALDKAKEYIVSL